MARSRSRSPGRRDRRRSRSRSRERERDRRRDRHRSRSRSLSPRGRSPRRHRSRSPRRRSWSRSPSRRTRDRGETRVETRGAVPKFLLERKPISEKDLEGKTPEEQDMIRMMGFGSFDTTKGKHVRGNGVYGVHIIHKRKYRQYMNRKGGFNRPLDFVA